MGRTYEVKNNLTTDKNYHSTIDICCQNIKDFDSYYKFTIVRNPWDRVCSWFYFRKDILYNSLYRKNDTKIRKFRGVSDKILLEEYNLMNNDFNEWLHLNIYKQWNNTWFALNHDQMTWINDVDMFDKICRFENLQTDLKQIPHFTNINFSEKNNLSSNDGNYTQLFSSESRDLIADIYKRDIETFNYEF